MQRRKVIVFLADGMADEPIASLEGRTPLEAAETPAMDRIAREGRNGTLLTLPEGFPTSSDVANMSVLGCDLTREFCGRGPLEAAGQGIALAPGDIAFRLNLISVGEDGRLKDFSGGHPAQSTAEALIARLDRALGAPGIRFYPGVSYRNLLILSAADDTDAVHAEKPDDHEGDAVSDNLPQARDASGEATAVRLRRLIAAAAPILAEAPENQRALAEERLPVNAIWPWSGGRAGALRTLSERHGIRSAVISAVDVINGLGRLLGMDVVRVPGATGYIDTNYEGKADAAIAAIRDHDFVYLHVEAMDEVSHNRNLELKLRAIEDFDQRVVARVMDAIEPDVTLVVLPDHPVPIAHGKHTRDPVPVAIRGPGLDRDDVLFYSERLAPTGTLGALAGPQLMQLLYPWEPIAD